MAAINVTHCPQLVTPGDTADHEVVIDPALLKEVEESRMTIKVTCSSTNSAGIQFAVGEDASAGASYAASEFELLTINNEKKRLHVKAASASDSFKIAW